MTTLYLIRHGETDFNRQGIVQGGGIDSHLNETGHMQAQAFFQAYGHIRFDAVYASTLRRTHQTLAPFLSYGHALRVHEGLNELGWGVQEGQNPDGAAKTQFQYVLQRWKDGYLDEKVEGGESPLEGWARAKPLFERLAHDHPHQTLLLCSHGRQLRIILSEILGKGLHNMHLFDHHNTALNLVRLAPDGAAFAEKLNDITHLAPLNGHGGLV